MDSVTLKRATSDDKQEVADIEKKTSSEIYHARISEKEINDFFENNVIYLIKNGDVCVGFTSYENISEKSVHIDGLVIKEEYRRHGYAKQAMAILFDKLSDCSRIELVTHPHNNNALCLYLSIGFYIESWQDNYFGDGQPRLMLVKK